VTVAATLTERHRATRLLGRSITNNHQFTCNHDCLHSQQPSRAPRRGQVLFVLAYGTEQPSLSAATANRNFRRPGLDWHKKQAMPLGKTGVRWFLYAANSAKFSLGYPSRLLIYDAGDYRTSWISFWKAVAILECGTALVFAVPPVWKNENQPDPNLRKAQAILSRCCPNKFIPLICPMPRSFITSLVLPQSLHFVPSVVDSLCSHTPGDCFTAFDFS
jgi:hypothetical protein